MNKYQTLREDLKKYQLAKDSFRLGILRFLLSDLTNFAIEKRKPVETLEDSEVESVLVKICKQRTESIEAFKAGNRQDLVDKEQAELDFITTYLPKQLSEQETVEAVEKAIEQIKPEGVKDMGKVIGYLKQTYGASIDISKASGMVKNKIG